MSREAEVEARQAALAAALAGAGLSAWGPISRASLDSACSGLSPETRAKFGVDRAGGAVAAALAYGPGPAEPPPWARAYGGPPLAIARFARADWYAELSARLRGAAAKTRESLSSLGLEPGAAREWRNLSNSGLPEKPLALAAGLGRLGRNGLVIVRADPEGRGGEIGSGAVLGLLLLPFEPALPAGGGGAGPEARPGPRPEALAPGGLCGSCRACVEACPTGALGEDGSFARESCIQHWTAREGSLPALVEAAWGDRLYGCEACLEACPFYRAGAGRGGGGEPPSCARGALGPSLPAGFFLEEGDAAIRERLRGTALGLGWMRVEAFRRSARLAVSRRGR